MDSTELLFGGAFEVIKSKFSDSTINKNSGKIYKLVNNKDNKIYIGSTIGELSIRLEYHKKVHANKLLGNYFLDPSIIMTIELIIEKNFYYDGEMLLLEDYYIYKHDSINNGLNQKYNTDMGKIIFSTTSGDYITKVNTIENVIDYDYKKYVKYCNLCKDANMLDIINSLRDANIKSKNFIRSDENLYVYYPDYLIDKHMDVSVGNIVSNYDTCNCDNDILGIYYIEWDNGNHHLFYKSGGLHTMFKTKSNMYYNKFFKLIMTNGIKFRLYPLYYYKMINSNIDGYIIGDTFRNYMAELEKMRRILKNMNVSIPNALRLTMSVQCKNTKTKMYSTMIDIEIKNTLFAEYNHKLKAENDFLIHDFNKKIKYEDVRAKIDIQRNEKNEINYGGFTFSKSIGRPKKYDDETKKQAKLDAKKKWREANKARIKEYNYLYHEEHKNIK